MSFAGRDEAKDHTKYNKSLLEASFKSFFKSFKHGDLDEDPLVCPGSLKPKDMQNDLASFSESLEQKVLKSFLVSFWPNAKIRDIGKWSKALMTKDNEKV